MGSDDSEWFFATPTIKYLQAYAGQSMQVPDDGQMYVVENFQHEEIQVLFRGETYVIEPMSSRQFRPPPIPGAPK